MPREKLSRERAICTAHDWKQSHASLEDFASVSQVKLSREILAKHFCRTMNYAIPKPIGDGKHTQIFYGIQHHAMRAYF